jgi:hypothetical protein
VPLRRDRQGARAVDSIGIIDQMKALQAGELAILFTILSVAFTVVGVLILKPILRLFIGRGDPQINETIGYATATFTLFYALLAGLLTVAAYQNRDRVQQNILNEAGAISALYAGMNSYPEPLRSDVKDKLRDYVLFTIYRDWDAHREGQILNGGGNRIDAIRQKLATYEPASISQQIVHGQTMATYGHLTEARQQRLNGVITRIPAILWNAMLIGAVLNLVILIMLRIKLIPHLILAALSAFFLFVVIYVIVVLDNPLRGATGLDPDGFTLIWERQMVWDEPLQ